MFSWESPCDRDPRSGRLRIHDFARKGNWRMVRNLVKRGVSLNSLDFYGYTALHHAVLSKDLQTVLMTLPRKSPIGECTSVDHAAKDSMGALHLAAKQGLPRMVHAIVDYAEWMVREGVMQPWERHVMLNARTSDGKTPLALATISGDLQAVTFLANSGAKMDLADRVEMNTPAHWADKLLDGGVMRILLANGASVDKMNKVGKQPLGNVEMLGDFRNVHHLHYIPQNNIRKFRYEKDAVTVDARYTNTLLYI